MEALVKRPEESHFEALAESSEHIEQEARMVLPGIQALFGFQLIAVFNARFTELTQVEQYLHWVALLMTAVATLYSIAPAAYHRQAEPNHITREFVTLASKWLCRGMAALALGICLDFYLIGRIISSNRILSGIAAIALFGVFKYYWTIFPRQERRQGGMTLIQAKNSSPATRVP